MNKLTNENGLSLVELLAAIVILAITSILIFSVISSSQTQYSKQSNKNTQLSDISYKLKVLTKDIRMADEVVYSVPDSFNIILDDGSTIKYEYDTDANILTKDSKEFLSEVEIKMQLHPPLNGSIKVKILEIKIENISTQIVVREGH